jgi:hypothetical protein
MQKPMLGMYNIRSATTNPTGKNRFVAGKNGSTVSAIPCKMIKE